MTLYPFQVLEPCVCIISMSVSVCGQVLQGHVLNSNTWYSQEESGGGEAEKEDNTIFLVYM